MVFSVDELIAPIEIGEPTGRDLRYEPIIDAIQEARSEEDDSLPMGDWGRQAKRADYPLVATLTRDALSKRSKDLWLAVWLGEASLKVEEYEAISPVITLLLELQRRFWPTLYPEIDDGDVALRAAPLAWALLRYAKVVQEFPVTESGISYATYKSARLSGNTEARDGAITGERLDAEIAATPKMFYVEIEERLAKSRELLEELYQFCEDRYKEEGPSFSSLRSALEEVHNLVSQILRLKRAQEPDPLPQEQTLEEPTLLQEAGEAPAASMQEPVSLEPPAVVPESVVNSKATVIDSWETALRQLAACADFLITAQPAHPTTYLLTLALQQGKGSSRQIAPSSEIRLALKRVNEAGEWDSLLQSSLATLQEGFSRAWLDLHRYIWQAAEAVASPRLQDLVLTQTRVLLENDPSQAEAFFEDDTPVANTETRQWLTETILTTVLRQHDEELPLLKPEPALSTTEQADPGKDRYLTARELASQGELAASIELLFADRAVRAGSRTDFMIRMQLCRLCLESGHGQVALPIMRQMLAAIDEKKLDQWEEPEVLSELYSHYLTALSGTDNTAEQEAVYARLCEIHPAAAIAFEMAR